MIRYWYILCRPLFIRIHDYLFALKSYLFANPTD